MKSYLISDNRDTLLGMRLAGIDGVIRHGRKDILEEIEKIIKEKTIGIVMITERAFKEAEEEIMALKMSHKEPLIVVIPDRHGFGYGEDFITKYINQSVGLKI